MIKVFMILGLTLTLLAGFFTFLILASSHAISDTFRHNMSMISMILAILTSFLFISSEYLKNEFNDFGLRKWIMLISSLAIGILYQFYIHITSFIVDYALFPKNVSSISIVARIIDTLIISCFIFKFLQIVYRFINENIVRNKIERQHK